MGEIACESELKTPSFQVLTVTTSAARVKSLVEACSELARGDGLFLVADKNVLSGDLFSHVWQTVKLGEPGKMFEWEPLVSRA